MKTAPTPAVILQKVAPALEQMGATKVGTLRGDIVADFGTSAPVARGTLAAAIEGVDLVVRGASGTVSDTARASDLLGRMQGVVGTGITEVGPLEPLDRPHFTVYVNSDEPNAVSTVTALLAPAIDGLPTIVTPTSPITVGG